MDLILWRHADAEDGLPDTKRGLTGKGERQAQGVAAWLEERLPDTTRILVSPAKRAQQTASALGREIVTLPSLSVGADATTILAAAGWPDAKGAVVIVGHQPTLGRVAALLLSGVEADWSIKKGAAWWLTNRVRQEDAQTVLRAVISPELL